MTERKRLSSERDSITHSVKIAGTKCYFIVSMYPEGHPGEVFIHTDTEGSTLGGAMESLSLMISISLQHGVPLVTIVEKLKFLAYEPKGITNNPAIPFTKSISDYLACWLEQKFISSENEV
jgi:ribonucleoside-diphosphate reductase alpha chain